MKSYRREHPQGLTENTKSERVSEKLANGPFKIVCISPQNLNVGQQGHIFICKEEGKES